jgi:HD-GYP domain-containing protein (c-di-GMP phosphodiesterase class II)
VVDANSLGPDRDLAAEVSHLAESNVLQSIPLTLLLSIMDAVESREPYVRSRTRSVAAYAVATARELRLPADQTEHVRLGAILCNLGMLRVPEAILQKRSALTPEEQARVRHHPLRSAEMLSGVPELEPVIPIVLHHHEDWRGGGYPIGISGERIPLGARIIRLCETYDALTSERAHRAAHPPHEALKVIAAGSGRQFDPAVVEAFVRAMRRPPVRDDTLSRWDTLEATTRAWRVVAATDGTKR